MPDVLLEQPVVTGPWLRRRLGVSAPTASQALAQLVARGIVEPVPGTSQPTVYRAAAAIDLLDAPTPDRFSSGRAGFPNSAQVAVPRAPALSSAMHRLLLLLLLVPGVSTAAPDPIEEAEDAPADPLGAAASITDPALAELLVDHWSWTMWSSPRWASELGLHQHDDRMEDNSPEAWARELQTRSSFYARALAMDAGALSAGDNRALRLLRLNLKSHLDRSVCRTWDWAVSSRRNPLVELGRLPELHELKTQADADALLARLGEVAGWVDQQTLNLRAGQAAGRVGIAETIRRTVEQSRETLARGVDELPLLKLEGQPALVEATRPLARAIAEDQILPALLRYTDALQYELHPVARPDDRAGLTHLPGGNDCYAALVRHYTTLDRSPEELHQLGLEQLAFIHAEFQVIGQRALQTAELATIFQRLRSDPSLRFETAEQVEAAARDALARAKAVMDQAFGRLPQAECLVRPIPAHEAPYTTIAYYSGAHPNGGKPGEYFVNTHAPETRPRFEAEVLAFHEAIPGHHLERSLSQELAEAPAFLKHGGWTAFVEGWALYTERLSDELGLYSGDLDRLGMLSFDSWRAARLVVDTGIHSFGWSRQQAIDFLVANTPLALNNIDNEVDRYINTPGQALAYKVGQLEILALRREAEKKLGMAFDLRTFHDVVLESGALPLPLLRERVELWVREGI